MKKIYLLSTLLLLSSVSFAQSALDAYQFSQPDLKGTARFMSMGGAFGALGGDLSSISQNPAGIGVYRSSEIGFTLDFDIQNSLTQSSDMKATDNQFKFLFNNAGYIGTVKLNSSVMPNFNWGLSYNKVASFNRRYVGGVQSLSTSMSNYIAGIANSDNITVGDLETTESYDPYNPKDGGYVAPWLAILAYDSYLINPDGNGLNPKWSGLWGKNTTGSGYFNVMERGGIDEYNISFGGNFANLVYWGMDFGIIDMNYSQTSLWTEQLSNAYVANGKGGLTQASADWDLYNYYSVKGAGFNYKLGVIVKPIQELRLGFAFHTPTWYVMDEVYYADTQYNYGVNNIRPGGAKTNNGYDAFNEYRFHTPWRLIASAAGVISNKFIISADYEWSNYQGMGFDSRYDEYDFWAPTPTQAPYYYTNKDIDDYYQATNTIRIGAEYRITPQISARVGYANVSSPVNDKVKNNEMMIYTAGTRPNYSFDVMTNYITCGFGFKIKKFYTDLAYVYKNRSSEYHAFTPDTYSIINVSPQSKITSENHQIVVSMGFKF